MLANTYEYSTYIISTSLESKGTCWTEWMYSSMSTIDYGTQDKEVKSFSPF